MRHHLLPNNFFNLFEVIGRLPDELTYAHYSKLLGDKLVFTKNEMTDIVHRALCIVRGIDPTSVASPMQIDAAKEERRGPKSSSKAQKSNDNVAPVVVADLKIAFKPAEIKEEISYVPMKDRRCRALKLASLCGNDIVNKGVDGSGFCADCWHPTVVSDHETYDGLREEGMTRNDAAVYAGLFAAPETKKKHNVTYATKSPDKRLSRKY